MPEIAMPMAAGNGKVDEGLIFSAAAPLVAKALSQAPAQAEQEIQTSHVFRHIPESIWNPVEEAVKAFLNEEIGVAINERSEFMGKLARWKEAYAAPLSPYPKNFPLRNSSNLTVPVIKEIVNTLVAQLVQATLTARPRWVFQDLHKEWEPFKDDIEKFLDLSSERDFDLEREAIEWIVECAKLGTSIMEVGYEVDIRDGYSYTADGKKVYPNEVVHKDGPVARRIPLQDFFIRFGERNIQTARWCGKRVWLTPAEAKVWEQQGRLYGLDKVAKFYKDQHDEVTEKEDELTSTEAVQPKYYEVFVLYLLWDVNKKGRMTDMKVYYHRDSNTVIGRFFNPYDHNKRSFIKLGYFPHEGRFYDEGLCEMLEAVQLGISTKHNQRSDNATMANLKMIVKRKMIDAFRPGDPLYTGKSFEVNDIWNDIREFQMAEIYPSTIQEEAVLRNYADRLSGINDAVTGSAMPVTRTTFGAQLALLQEQTKRIDLTVRSIRKGLNEVGYYVLMMFAQFGTHGKALAWMGDNGRLVDAIFRLPRRVHELGLGLKATVPTSLQNKQAQREGSIAMFNLMVQLYEKMLPLVQGIAPQALPIVVAEMTASAKRFMGDVLESFEVTDSEDMLAGLTVLERILPRAEDLGGGQDFARGEEGAEVIDRLARLESIYQEARRDQADAVGLSSGNKRAGRTTPPEGRARGVDAGLFFGGGTNLRSRGE